jgi:hypothetical protein
VYLLDEARIVEEGLVVPDWHIALKLHDGVAHDELGEEARHGPFCRGRPSECTVPYQEGRERERERENAAYRRRLGG